MTVLTGNGEACPTCRSTEVGHDTEACEDELGRLEACFESGVTDRRS